MKEIGVELEGRLFIEKSVNLFPVKPWTRVGDKRYLFEASFPLSDLADPPTGKRPRPLHLVFGTMLDMEVTPDQPCYFRVLEKFVAEGLCEGRWCKKKVE